MTVENLLAELEQQQIHLWLEDDQLRYRAPQGALTKSLRDAIARQKQDIMLRLQSSHPLPQLTPDPAQHYQPFPLNDIQQAYWLGRGGNFEMGNVSTHVYLEIDCQDLDLKRLNDAWNQVIDRHEMLRVIVYEEGQQQILETVPPYDMTVLDLRAESEEADSWCGAIATQLATLRQRMSHQVRPADRWPLFEICASCLVDNITRLHISIDGLIADGRSLFLLFQDWSQWYRNPALALPPLQLSFRDYVLAETALQESPTIQTALDYWRDRIPHLPLAPALPLAKNPSTLDHPRFVRYGDRLAPDVWNRLKAHAQAKGLTPSGVLLAAYAQVLATWSKSLQFTLNVTLSNRLPLHPQVNDLVGVFSSIDLLEVDYSQQDSFADRALRLQQQLWQDLDHCQLSGIRVLRELARLRQTGASAQMPVVFTSTLLDLSQLGWMGEIVYWITQTPQVWLDCQVYEQHGGLFFSWDAVEDLFPAELVSSMFGAYRSLLQQLADRPEVWQQSYLSLIPSEQQHPEINATPIPDDLLHTLFNRRAKQQPEQAAVIAGDLTLTYGELQQQSYQIGHWLRQRGARPNQLVAVLMEKGWEQIAAVLGVLQSGAAYLPIDPTLPLERLHYVLKDGEVGLVLTQSHLRDKLALPDTLQYLCVDTDELGAIATPLEPIQTLDDLAYVIYTSGSTGTPKGVMIAHRGVVNAIAATNHHFEVSVADRVLGLTALHHDMSVYDIFGTLAAGGAIVLPEAASQRDPIHWLALIHRHQVTLWNSVPAMMEMLLESISRPGLKNQTTLLRSLRLAFLGGDWIPPSLPERLHSWVETVQIVSVGGPTETTLWNIWHPIERIDPAWKSIPYGRAIANTRYYVLNEKLEPCPNWVPGQLYCAGVGLAQGYWRDSEKTKARFIHHPQTGERLYQTGDLGRFLPDGTLEFLGRQDFQVKINGLRIELGEIESVLSQHPLVQSTVVVAEHKKSLVAYIVPKHERLSENSADIWEEGFRQYLAEQLPAHMIPARFIRLEQLPLTANGKVDRQALAKLEPHNSETIDADEAPRNSIEIQLASIWKELLSLEHIGIHANFFQMGGNSLLAVQLINRIAHAFQIELPLNRLFNSPTIAALSLLLEHSQATVAHPKLDLLSESVLDPDIRLGKSPVCSVSQPQSILLTGATGYLGAFLLYELLHQTSAVVYCLVRSDTIASAKARLRSNLKLYALWDEGLGDRIIPVLGDLSQPLLGLTQEQFQALAIEIDSIYHNGAVVNFTYPYAALKATNVLGTQEVLRLAAQQKTKPVHFISSIHVFPTDPSAENQMVWEKMTSDSTENLPTGYVQSKWVAEKLIAIAQNRGFPISIYRPSFIVGHQETGAGNAQDLMFRMIKGCIQLGIAPDIDLSFNIVPVDYVSKAIAHLSTKPDALGQTFHLVNPHHIAISWHQILQWLQTLGHCIPVMAYPQWLTALQSRNNPTDNALYPLLPVFLETSQGPSPDLIHSRHEIQFDCQNTLSYLSDTALNCPPIDLNWLRKYLSFFRDDKILTPAKPQQY
jgi:pyochelin synthetase